MRFSILKSASPAPDRLARTCAATPIYTLIPPPRPRALCVGFGAPADMPQHRRKQPSVARIKDPRAGAIWCTLKPFANDAVGARERQVVVGSGPAALGWPARKAAARPGSGRKGFNCRRGWIIASPFSDLQMAEAAVRSPVTADHSRHRRTLLLLLQRLGDLFFGVPRLSYYSSRPVDCERAGYPTHL